MTITNTITGKRILSKVTRILVAPYANGAKGATAYALDNIVADSTEVSSDDNNHNEINCETRDENITDIVTLGKVNFKAESADWQDILLEKVYGFTKVGDNKYARPDTYQESFAEVELQFGDANAWTAESANGYIGSIVLPKVQLDNSLSISSLKSDVGRFTVGGTAYSAVVGQADSKDVYSPFYFSKSPVNVATT